MKFKSISEYLEKTGKTQTELAAILEISQAFLNEIIKGKKRPSPELAAKIESTIGVPFRSLLFPKVNPAA